MSNSSFSRREVLRLLATSFAALMPFQVRDVRAQSADSSVLIIGAGVAGLAAAQLLQAEGWQVTVLEARDRIGGRIWTNRSLDGLPLDLGASWIHGVNGNPLTELADAAGVSRVATDFENMLVYRDDGTLVDDEQIQALEALLLTILETADEFAGEYDEDISLGTIIREAIEEEADDLSSDEQMLLAYLVNTSIEHEYGASIEQLSAFHWQSGRSYSGGDVISVQGYDWLINLLASGLDIRLNTPVELIEYDDEAVYISTDGEEWEADYALITVPLGVLKAGTIQFDPPLPDRKLAAIDSLQMGTLNKLYLHFPAVFWDQEMDFIDIASAQDGQSVEMLNISLIHDQPVLLCFYAADFARTIESWEDARIIEHTMGMLRALYGEDLPAPDGYLLTRWGQDVYSYGSYSFYGVESSPDDRLALAQPVADRLFFAGEATHDTDPSTVHGALLSGWRAAEELLDLE